MNVMLLHAIIIITIIITAATCYLVYFYKVMIVAPQGGATFSTGTPPAGSSITCRDVTHCHVLVMTDNPSTPSAAWSVLTVHHTTCCYCTDRQTTPRVVIVLTVHHTCCYCTDCTPYHMFFIVLTAHHTMFCYCTDRQTTPRVVIILTNTPHDLLFLY